MDKGLKWITSAAEQGLFSAQLSLGVKYANGQGMKKDPEEALIWFNFANLDGDKKAEWWISEISKELSTEQIARAQKVTRELIEDYRGH